MAEGPAAARVRAWARTGWTPMATACATTTRTVAVAMAIVPVKELAPGMAKENTRGREIPLPPEKKDA